LTTRQFLKILIKIFSRHCFASTTDLTVLFRAISKRFILFRILFFLERGAYCLLTKQFVTHKFCKMADPAAVVPNLAAQQQDVAPVINQQVQNVPVAHAQAI
jgi:hypothetical protein